MQQFRYLSNEEKLAYVNYLASLKGGVCLSTEYKTSLSKLEFKCKLGHKWFATTNKIKDLGSWCPKCAGCQKLTIEEMKELAISRGGECISTEYKNSHTNLTWKCLCGCVWSASPSNIIYNNSWCPECYGNIKLTIEEMKEIAISRGGECISTEYVNINSHLTWKCEKGHIWDAIANDVKNKNTWCPKCAGCQKLTIEEMKEIARSRGGECISTEYKGCDSHLTWKCSEGHIWKAVPNHIKNSGSWCPTCKSSKGEESISNILNEMKIKFKEQFILEQLPKKRFDFYIEESKILIEYHGVQHFKFNEHFHKTPEVFEEARERDRIKFYTAHKLGYKLIYIDFKQVDNIKFHIENGLKSEDQIYFSTPSMFLEPYLD